MRAAQGCVAPESTEAMSDFLAGCDRSSERVCIVGGNTLAGMGFPLEGGGVTLTTTRLAGIVANERADLTVAVRAGTTLQSLALLLSAQEQFVPFDAPQPHDATVGGTLAAGWLGPRRHLHGRARDFVIGSTIVLADGTVARAGGMVVKNVAGYDMSRLYVGSFGTLGVLVQVNLKTAPLPRCARLFVASLPAGTRGRAWAQLRSLDIRPAAAFWVAGFQQTIEGDDGEEGRVVAMVEGSDALLERAMRDLRSALGRAGVPATRIFDVGARESFGRIVDAYVACLGERSITYRLQSLTERLEERAVAMNDLAQRLGLRAESIVDVMNGDVVVRVSDFDARALESKIERFDDALHACEPRAQVIAGKHPHRQFLRVWGEAPAAIEHMRSLKARFDPNRTLNAGRFVGANSAMRVALLGGSGFVGKHLQAALRARGDDVVLASLRDPVAAADAAADCDAIVNLAGEPIGQRWSAALKRRIEESRVERPRQFLDALAPRTRRCSAYVSSSAVGYYGTSETETFFEDSPPGNDFLARVCVRWEREAERAVGLGMRVARIRSGVALGDGGALEKIVPPFRAGLGGRVGSGRQWLSWIHIDDLVGIYLLAVDTADGALNGSAPEPVTNAAFTERLGEALHRPTALPVPPFALRMLLGEGADMLLTGQRALPRRTQQLGYRFRFTELRSALANLLTP